MKKHLAMVMVPLAATVALCAALSLHAAEGKKNVIGEVMDAYHKAPKGVDPVCKRAADGKATPDELKKLVDGYKKMAAAKPPKGDDASWKDKTTKLLAAAKALQKGEVDAAAKYKDAVNCKSCHMAHKAD